jgi:hypothetical protein
MTFNQQNKLKLLKTIRGKVMKNIPNPNPKWQKMNSKGQYLIYPNGEKVMESRTGVLLEEETIKDLDYLKEYLCEFL